MKKIVAKPSYQQIENVGNPAEAMRKKPAKPAHKQPGQAMPKQPGQAAPKQSTKPAPKPVPKPTPKPVPKPQGEPHDEKPSSDSVSASTKRHGSKYIPALDGLRAFAVIAVVLYHMSANLLPSGLLGVTLFFVLSGYLITGILIREWSQTGKIDLPRFWIHRVRRLFPAIVFMLCAVLIITALVAPDMLTKLRNDLFAALFWFTNWWYIFQDLSYFEAMGAPSPVTHFWSLAIEEQFYVVWPPLLLLLFKGKVKKQSIQRIILGLAIVSVLLMALLYVPDGDPSRVYYGTDTRAFSLLIGAFLAFVLPVHRVCGHGRKGLKPKQREVIGIVGIICCVGIILLMVFVDGYSPFLYYGGILLVSVLTGGLIIALVDPHNVIAKVFSWKPLVYVGKISYGIYIWHYPILLLMTDFNSASETPFWWFIIEALVVLGVSAFSYRFVEQPIRQGCLGRYWHAIRDKKTTFAKVVSKHVPQLACAVALVVGATVACIVTPYTTTQAHTYDGGAIVPEGALGEGGDGAAGSESEQYKRYLIDQLGENPILWNLSIETLESLVGTEGATAEEKAHNTSFILIGDSITAVFTRENFGDFAGNFPNAILDSEKNRTIAQGVAVMDSYLSEGWNGPVVIFELGTNVRTTKAQIEEMIATVPEGKMIFLITVRAHVDHMDETNATLREIASEHDNIQVIDWYGASSGHSEYFDGDGTHLTPTLGVNAYQGMLLSALETLYGNEGNLPQDSGATQEGESSSSASSSE